MSGAGIGAAETARGDRATKLLFALVVALWAAWTVPLGFSVMYVVSLLTQRHLPPGVQRTMVRLHAPENLGLDGSGASADERS